LIDAGDSLHSSDGKKYEVNVVGTLLRLLPELKTLDAINYSIEADYLLAEPWVCRDLQTFRCQIIGMNRLSVKEEDIYSTWVTGASLGDKEGGKEKEEDVDSNHKDGAQDVVKVKGTVEQRRQCYDLHGRVYSRLAEMTQLRVLDLGHEFRDFLEIFNKDNQETKFGGRLYSKYSPPISNTLELSLESGLGQLDSLKNMEVFGFEGVDHRIGIKELAWMAESWPRLRIMRGLHDPWPFAVVYSDPETQMLMEYLEELRPSVKHEGLGDEHA
ncbi:hypothetical protein BGZ95_006467, partial [Linnemannia exigua]